MSHEATPNGEGERHDAKRSDRPDAADAADAADTARSEVTEETEGSGDKRAPSPDQDLAELIEAEAAAIVAEAAAQKAAGPGQAADSPRDPLAKALAERDEYLDLSRRVQAEFENYRKRMLRQQTDLLDRASEGLINRLLPFVDALELSAAHAAPGPTADAFDKLRGLLRDVLTREGMERIDEVGVPFSPEIHDAVAREDAAAADTTDTDTTDTDHDGAADTSNENADGAAEKTRDKTADKTGKQQKPAKPKRSEAVTDGPVVVEVLRPGFKLKGKVLRPAMVKVRG